MKQSKNGYVIINRSFWPENALIGGALLNLAEKFAENNFQISVITRDTFSLKEQLKLHGRGTGVNFFLVKGLATSGSSLIIKILEAIYFNFNVFRFLRKTKPSNIYISTDPPVLVPFFVMIYCFVYKTKYVYHIQDIHPEATDVVFPLNRILFNILQQMDKITILRAGQLITINENMANSLRRRIGSKIKIQTLANPSLYADNSESKYKKNPGFAFCGNLGRFQHINLMLIAIKKYYDNGGALEFIFAGDGFHSKVVSEFSHNYPLFKFIGKVKQEDAFRINKRFKWIFIEYDSVIRKCRMNCSFMSGEKC